MADFNPAKVRFSGLSTLEKCGGQAMAVKDLPKHPGNEAAALGTNSHDAVSMIVALGGGKASDFVEGLPDHYAEAVEEAAQITFAVIEELTDLTSPILLQEQFLDVSALFDVDPLSISGTPDVRIVSAEKKIGVALDYKFGLEGIDPSVLQNRVVLLDMAMRHPELDTFVSIIVQPRSVRPTDFRKEASYTREELIAWRDEFRPRLVSILNGTAVRAAGPHCRYCRALGTCSTAKDHILSQLHGFAAPDTLSGEQIADVLRLRAVINEWLACVNEEGTTRASVDENAIPGFLIGAKVTHRKWACDEAVLNILNQFHPELIDQLAPRKLVSPKQVLDAVDPSAAGELAPLVVKPQGVASLIPRDVAARKAKLSAQEATEVLSRLTSSGSLSGIQFDESL